MNLKRFLFLASIVLATIGFLGVVGLFGYISSASFFHPPYWINWLHFILGIFVLIVALKGNAKLQALVVSIPMVLATALGVLGLVFGSYAAKYYNIPELADPSDHLAHLIVGVVAFWAWRNRERVKNRIRLQTS